MGRYPWNCYARKLIEERVDWSTTKDGTRNERERRLRYLGKVVRELVDRGEMSTTNPRAMKKDDILALFRHLKEAKRLAPNTLRKHLALVQQITAIAGNSVVYTMRNHPVDSQKLPRGTGQAGKRSFNTKAVLAFLDAARARAEASAEWWDTAAYGAAVLAVGFGLRPKELRAAEIGNLDKVGWMLRVGYSKTEPDYTTLLPPFEDHLVRYLELRARTLERAHMDPKKGLMLPALESRGIRNPGGTLGSNHVRKMFSEIRGLCGIPISPKDMRTSFGQILFDNKEPLDKCSKHLRHGSTKTTEQFYLKLRPQDTFERLKQLFEKAEQEDGKKEMPKEGIKPLDRDSFLYR